MGKLILIRISSFIELDSMKHIFLSGNRSNFIQINFSALLLIYSVSLYPLARFMSDTVEFLVLIEIEV
jgi:hypothetical protein